MIATRDRICADSAVHVGTVLVGEFYDDWLALVAAAVPAIPAAVVRNSAGALLGVTLTDEALRDFAWRLAGNVATARRGRPAVAWELQRESEWMPLFVEAARPGRDRRDRPGHWLTFRVMAGTACPMQVRRFLTRAEAKYVASLAGYNPRAGRRFPGAHHFVGMLFYGLFEPQLSADRPGFRQVRVPQSMLDHNVELIAGRKVKPCPTEPYRYRHPCEACVIGYEECRFALHARSFAPGRCDSCGRDDAPIDPENPAFCVECDPVLAAG